MAPRISHSFGHRTLRCTYRALRHSASLKGESACRLMVVLMFIKMSWWTRYLLRYGEKVSYPWNVCFQIAPKTTRSIKVNTKLINICVTFLLVKFYIVIVISRGTDLKMFVSAYPKSLGSECSR